ncbi:MAG: hypothetical protein HDKAJFGB_01821 [Anaerolineae bacterium]|nr:hypothetical protein [Anaerolineae bacterium]RIK24523.1 MAG: hypothetical protein DCC52_12415 [Chloroflexota bacterium]
MYQFPSDWLTVYADHRVVFTYPKFVEAIGNYIDDIGFVDLYPEPIRLNLQMRYKEFPPPMEGDLYLQRFPPLDVQIWGLPRRVGENGNIGEIIGELKQLGTITVFCSTARELKIDTVYEQSAPRGVQEVIIALGKKINACIDNANAHPIPSATESRNSADSSMTIQPTAHAAPQSAGQLTALQKVIIQAVKELKKDYADPPDEAVAAKIGLNPRGQPYTRETINRERSKLRKMNVEV